MSRRSQAFADGQPAFSWRVEAIEPADASKGRFKCTCKTHPEVFGFGDTEELAILHANKAMETAVDKADVGMQAPGGR